MTSFFIFLLIGILAVILPIVSALVWFFIFSMILPGLVTVVKGLIHLETGELWKRDVSITFTQLLFHLSLMVSIPASALLELVFLIPFALLLGVESGWTQTLVVASAGPIEELMKFLSAVVVYIVIYLTHNRLIGHGSKVKVGMVSGLFAGAVFGFVESIGYLSLAVEEVLINGPTLQYMDAFIWRLILGVSIHASYTCLASGGIGRDTWVERIKVTIILLGISILYHTFNNGIQGFIFLILGMDDTAGYIIVDVLQALLAVSNLAILILVWRGILFKSKPCTNYRRKMYRSKRIYPTPRDLL